mgnify:CR=1 FL=1
MNWTEEALERCLDRIGQNIERIGEHFPHVAYDNVYNDQGPAFWVSGFWPGLLWLRYQGTKDEKALELARRLEDVMDSVLDGFMTLHHDVGFMWLPSAVIDYKLTGNEASKIRGLKAASHLAGRFNLAGQFIRAWTDRVQVGTQGWAIIDCMMNIPLLYWAGKEMEDPRFTDIANRHAETAMRVLLRPDGSCNHIGILDPETGEVLSLPGGQGYGEGSSWSRGQAWAVYGFALAFLHTGNQEFLDAAKRAAHYFLANVAMTGYVSLVDFRAPKEPVYWDTTATACAACGLLQIAEMVPEFEKDLYYDGKSEAKRS